MIEKTLEKLNSPWLGLTCLACFICLAIYSLDYASEQGYTEDQVNALAALIDVGGATMSAENKAKMVILYGE